MKEIRRMIRELAVENMCSQLATLRESCPDLDLSDPYVMGDRINVTMSMKLPELGDLLDERK